MRRIVMLSCAAGSICAAAALYACSSSEQPPPPPTSDDGGGDAPGDTLLGSPQCVTSPTPADFPSGACNAPRPAQSDAVDEALAAIGTDRCTWTLSWAKSCFMPPDDKRRMPDFTPLLTYPLRLPAWGAENAKWLDDAMTGQTPVASAIAAAAVRRGTPVKDCPDPTWFTVDGSDPAPLASALGELADFYNDANFDPQAASDAVSGVPLALQQALAPIVRAIGYGAQDVQDARYKDKAMLTQLAQTPAMIIGTTSPWDATNNPPPYDDFDKPDVGKMALAATRIATAIETANLARFAGNDVPTVEIATAFGAIVIHGASADTYMPKSKADGAALLLDTGGDDTYRIGTGAATLSHAVSVAIDLAGKDLYGYVEHPGASDTGGHRLPSDGAGRGAFILDADHTTTFYPTLSTTPRQGAGVLGVGMLFDYGGAGDTYRSLAASQGCGVIGVGTLYDDGGDDSYTSETFSQGAAGWGIGLLLDAKGNDRHVVYNESEGFGFTKGVGALVDSEGDDLYYADPGDPNIKADPANPSVGGDPLYANAQLPGPTTSNPNALVANTSMSQGAGEGFRIDVPFSGHPYPGGLGILRDASGKDAYVTGVFGQASSFSMGIGVLLEGGGDDTYEGLWYVQGSAAHTGITYFHDAAGNDKYDLTFPIAATSIGVGHDCSASIHFDAAGDDAYKGPGLSMGGGNALGIGLMVNAGGSDTFHAESAYSLGGAGWDYHPNQCCEDGVFVKAGGPSTYQVDGLAADAGGPAPGASWRFSVHGPDAGGVEKGAGLDRPSGSAALP